MGSSMRRYRSGRLLPGRAALTVKVPSLDSSAEMDLEFGNLKMCWEASCTEPSAGRSRIVAMWSKAFVDPVCGALPQSRRQRLQAMAR